MTPGETYYDALISEFSDGEQHCKNFLDDFFYGQLLVFSMPIAIVGINFIMRSLLRSLAYWER